MRKILVIFTGGTIGCAPAGPDGVRNLPAEPGKTWRDYALTARYAEEHPGAVSFEVLEPLRSLSENMTVSRWNILLKALRGVDFASYDGVVITHGTDTLAYTAALLGILLAHVPVPVTLVSAGAPLSDPATNGHTNFAGAVRFMLDGGRRGVYAVYSRNGRAEVIPATRLRQSRAFEDTFLSADGAPYAYVEDDQIQLTGMPPASVTETDYSLDALEPCVLMIEPYVGMDYTRYRLDGGEEGHPPRAVLHGLYHSFTCCVEGEGASVYQLLKTCREIGADVWFAPYRTQQEQYASTHELQKWGVRFLPDKTLELAYAKLLIAYSLFETAEEREAFLYMPW